MAHYSFTGYLNEKPELQYSQKGTAFTRFSVCESWRRKDNDKWVETAHNWWRCTAFNDAAEVCATFDSKCRVGVSGMLKFESWTNKEGEEKSGPLIIVDFMGLLWTPKNVKSEGESHDDVWGSPPDVSNLPF